MIPALTAIAEQHDLTLSVSVSRVCPWQHELEVPSIPGLSRLETCQTMKDDLYARVVPELDPDIVVAMNLGYDNPGFWVSYLGPDLETLDPSSREYDAWLERATVSALDELEADGRSVVVLEPIPLPRDSFDQLDCLSNASVVEECRYVTRAEPTPLEEIYRRLDAADDAVWSTDIDQLVCPFLPICDPIVNGQVVRTDVSHLSTGFAETLAPALEDYLVSNGIVPR
jgi:SGNH domain (fused to AT3 domains)